MNERFDKLMNRILEIISEAMQTSNDRVCEIDLKFFDHTEDEFNLIVSDLRKLNYVVMEYGNMMKIYW